MSVLDLQDPERPAAPDASWEWPTLLVAAAGQALVGTKLELAALDALDAAARAACNPISDKRGTAEYRTKIAGVLARRSAQIAYDRAKARA